MKMKKEFEMTEGQLQKLIDASKQSPLVAIHCGSPVSVQEKANPEWEKLGKEMGFDYETVAPVPYKDASFFTAVVTEIDEKSMKTNKDLVPEFAKLVKPLIQYINKHHHPHTKIIIDMDSAEVVSGEYSVVTDEFVKD